MQRTLYLLLLLPFTILTAQSPEDLSFSHPVDEFTIKNNASIHGFGYKGAILAELVKGKKMKFIKLTFFYILEERTDSVLIPTDYYDFLQVTKDSSNLHLLLKDGTEALIFSVNFQTRTIHKTVVDLGPNAAQIITHFAVLGDIAYIASYNFYGYSDALLLVGLRDTFNRRHILTIPKKSAYKEYDLRISQEQDEVYFFHSYRIRGGNEIRTYVFKKDGSLNFSRVCYRTDNKDEVYAPALKRLSNDRYVFIASIREVDTFGGFRIFELPVGPVTTGFVALTMSRDTILGTHYVHFRDYKNFSTVIEPWKKANENYWKGTVRCERIDMTENGNLQLHANCFITYSTETTTYNNESGYSTESGLPKTILIAQVNAEVDSSFNIICDHLYSLEDENKMIYNRNYSPDIWKSDRYVTVKDKCSSVFQDMLYRMYLDFDINSGPKKKKVYLIYYGEARKLRCE